MPKFRIFAPAAVLSLTVAFAPGAVAAPILEAQVAVTEVRVGVQPDATRVVLDLDRPSTKFVLDVAGDGHAVTVDVPGTDWRSGPFDGRHRRGPIAEMRVLKDGKLAILTDGPVYVKRAFVLGPNGTQGHRIVIDLADGIGGNLAGAAPPAPAPAVQSRSAPQFQRAAFRPVATGDRALNGSSPKMPGPPRTEVRPVPAAASAAPSRTQSSSESWGTPIAVAARRDTAPVEVAQAAQGGAVPGRYIQGVSTLYLRGHGGLGFLAEADTSGPGNTANVDFDLGYVLGGALGVEMENGIRIEGEIGYAANDVDSVTGAAAGIAFNSGNVNGSVSSLAMMGNLAYDLDLGGGIKPFVLGGIGLVRISVNDVSIAGTPVADDSDWVFGYQFGGGLKYDLTHQVGVEASYRYLETLDPEFVDSRGIPFEGEYQNHQFLIGAYYKF